MRPKDYIHFSLATLLLLLLSNCQGASSHAPKGISLEGNFRTELAGAPDSLYLYDVVSEAYHYLTEPIRAIPLSSDGIGSYSFQQSDTTLQTQVYFLSTSPESHLPHRRRHRSDLPSLQA